MKGTSSYHSKGQYSRRCEVTVLARTCSWRVSLVDQLRQWDFTELLLQPLRDNYGKDVDGVNWDILNAGNRTGSGSGASTMGVAATGSGHRAWAGFDASTGTSG